MMSAYSPCLDVVDARVYEQLRLTFATTEVDGFTAPRYVAFVTANRELFHFEWRAWRNGLWYSQVRCAQREMPLFVYEVEVQCLARTCIETLMAASVDARCGTKGHATS